MRNFIVLKRRMCPRPYSIKTRIKTGNGIKFATVYEDRPRPYSIKTRIKTFPASGSPRLYPFPVRDHIPLKQGLRLNPVFLNTPSRIVRDHIPLKQGLRQGNEGDIVTLSPVVRDHIPLKQGLRRAVEGTKVLRGGSETIFH